MYFSSNTIVNAIERLRKDVHPFFGITYLACKRIDLPVGECAEIKLDSHTLDFLNAHHKIDTQSEYFFQPYKSSVLWLVKKYPSAGLQAINTQTYSDVFLHERKKPLWGWQEDYIELLQQHLEGNKPIPLFELLVWLYKWHQWDQDISFEILVSKFQEEYNITQTELVMLFDCDLTRQKAFGKFLSNTPPLREEILEHFEPAPDVYPDRGGVLKHLSLNNVGPVETLTFEPGKRLSLITGDNGLGKSFILDCAWWALTGNWSGQPAYPRKNQFNDSGASIKFSVGNPNSNIQQKIMRFDEKRQIWQKPKDGFFAPGLIIYAKADGSFSIWDPIKISPRHNTSSLASVNSFSSREIWDGSAGSIEGLIRDWSKWQSNPDKYPFKEFISVLKHLSPPDLGELCPGEPVRIPDDPREIPTISHSYGDTPIVFSSAGVKRILALSYLIVWVWNEHNIIAKRSLQSPQRQLIVMIDEVEAHLHPKWQRSILPALMTIGEHLSKQIEMQLLVATHSPLVMASVESIFDENLDELYHLAIDDQGRVRVENIDFIKFGDVSSWLTSPLFDLKYARSREAEKWIERAKTLQLSSNPSIAQIQEVSQNLSQTLPADDKFWPRWVFYAEKYGIKL